MYFVCTINMRKERFVSKQGHCQPCKHSKAWILSLQLQMAIIMDVMQRERERRYCLPTEHQLLKIIIKHYMELKESARSLITVSIASLENFITFHCSWQMKLKHAGRREDYTSFIEDHSQLPWKCCSPTTISNELPHICQI